MLQPLQQELSQSEVILEIKLLNRYIIYNSLTCKQVSSNTSFQLSRWQCTIHLVNL